VLNREEERGDVVGFYHTHPSGLAAPSVRDVRTMRAWVSAFGKPLLCLIESQGSLVAFGFHDDESPGVRLEACQLFPRGVVIAFGPDY
jgi:proteasome lid subunit RPN8/RPN11